MKRTSLAIAALTALIFAACKKDRTCECTYSTVSRTSTDPNYQSTISPPSTSSVTYKKIKKNNVMLDMCVDTEDTDTYPQTGYNGTTTVQYQVTTVSKTDCEIK